MTTITSLPRVLGTGTYPLAVALGGAPALAARQEAELAAHAAMGFQAWEPCVDTVAELQLLAGQLPRHGLTMPSYYANARLHDAAAPAAITRLTALATAAQPMGARLLVTNPEPINWGSAEDKSDAELRAQAEALTTLGRALAPLGQRVAYHFHDAEFRCGAREVQHMLRRTDPATVGICFDLHWAYRGCGDSAEAVFDLLDACADRVVSFHLRQSQGGIWTEAFGAGDLDYTRWTRWIKAKQWHGPIILEQAWETGTPRTGDIHAAHAAGLSYMRQLIARL